MSDAELIKLFKRLVKAKRDADRAMDQNYWSRLREQQKLQELWRESFKAFGLTETPR